MKKIWKGTRIANNTSVLISSSVWKALKQSGANSWKLLWLLVSSLQLFPELVYDKSGGAARWAALFVVVLLWKVPRQTFLCWRWNENGVWTIWTLCFSSLSASVQTQNVLAWIWALRCKKLISPPTPRSEPATLVVNKWMWHKCVWSLISLKSHYLS